MPNAFRALALLSAWCAASPCHAVVKEEVIEVPVQVSNAYHRSFEQTIKVTVFHDPAQPPHPYLILNHGRPSNREDMSKVPRYRFSEVSRYFVSQGFVVLVPTRVGYGESGGPDVEDSGTCEARRYEPVYEAAAAQSHAVVAAARALPYVDTGRGLVVGQSFGGATALALAASTLPGMRGAINFAGGGGGNPDTHPEQPCSPVALQRLMAGYGATAKVKTLWLYSVNDRFWGPDLPKAWFAAYQAQGGQGRFASLPPYKDNGHGIFSGNPSAWQAEFETFVRELGF